MKRIISKLVRDAGCDKCPKRRCIFNWPRVAEENKGRPKYGCNTSARRRYTVAGLFR